MVCIPERHYRGRCAIAPGTRAAVVNWGRRTISLFWAVVWCLLAFARAAGSAKSFRNNGTG